MNSSSPVAAPHARVSHELQRARSVIEDRFLELGRGLESGVTILGALVRSLDQLAETLDGRAVDEATATLSDAAQRLGSLGASHETRRGRFEGLVSASGGLGLQLADMRRALAYLRAFGLSIKITAGGIPGAFAEFEAFSDELQTAISQAGSELDDFDGELAAVTDEVAVAMQQEGELQARCADALPVLSGRLANDAEAIGAHQRKISVLAAEVGALARGVQAKVAGAIAGLQIGDTTRQRVEHVEAALARLEALPASDDIRASVAPAIHALLAEQLQDSAEELGRDLESLEANLTALAGAMSEILRRRDWAGAGKDGALGRLNQSLAAAATLVSQLEAAEQASRDVQDSTERTARGLTQRIGSIRSIKASIQHMALNAHLKCTRIGDAGKPLSVIAIELRTKASELEATAQEAEGALALLGRAAEDGRSAEAATGSGEIGTLLEGAAAPVRAAAKAVDGEMSSLAAQAADAARSLGEATRRLDFRRDVGEVLSGAGAMLAQTAGPAPAQDTPGHFAWQALMDEISRHYTMARERQIHAAFAPASAPAVAGQKAA